MVGPSSPRIALAWLGVGCLLVDWVGWVGWLLVGGFIRVPHGQVGEGSLKEQIRDLLLSRPWKALSETKTETVLS